MLQNFRFYNPNGIADMKSDNDSSDDDIWSYSPLARVPKTSKIGDSKATTSETVDAAVVSSSNPMNPTPSH